MEVLISLGSFVQNVPQVNRPQTIPVNNPSKPKKNPTLADCIAKSSNLIRDELKYLIEAQTENVN
jgi:hypothetical protein